MSNGILDSSWALAIFNELLKKLFFSVIAHSRNNGLDDKVKEDNFEDFYRVSY